MNVLTRIRHMLATAIAAVASLTIIVGFVVYATAIVVNAFLLIALFICCAVVAFITEKIGGETWAFNAYTSIYKASSKE